MVHGGDQAKSIADLLALLVQLVALDLKAVDHLVVEVNLLAQFEHNWVSQLERQFELDFNIADSEAVFQLEFRRLDYVFGSFQHEVHL